MSLSRRNLLATTASAFVAAAIDPRICPAQADPAFALRGYYITLMRLPTLGLAAWKAAIDCFADDNINTLILWIAGGFKSKKFPITWKYNADHENIREDFLADLIRYAHTKNIRILLGFTPFGYDGVNQYTIEHPELTAKKKDGQPVDPFGIHCWGRNLCPSRPASQRFMLEYVREMCLDFYPQADGVLIESSDYSICHCPDCRGKFYEREFEFISAISADLWKAKPDATIVVYPHYFSGAKVPGMDANAAQHPFDPRWTLFFTPHSAHIEAKLITAARASIFSDDAPALRDPATIQRRAQEAHKARITGHIPSLEGFSYVTTHVEEGRDDLVGERQIPFGFGWLKRGEMPFDELPVRVHRIAYREFSQRPDLRFDQFKRALGLALFKQDNPQWTDDALTLSRVFFAGRSWCQPAALISPQRVRVELAAKKMSRANLSDLRKALTELEHFAARHADAADPGRREMHRIAGWVLDQWQPADRGRLDV